MPSSLRARSWSMVGWVSIACFSSVEVAGATDVRVHDRRPVRGGGRPSAIEVGLQDGGNRGVGARANLERAATGGFQSLIPEAVGVPEDADRGAEALLRMRLLAQDDLDLPLPISSM
jgi:hypothetical protein